MIGQNSSSTWLRPLRSSFSSFTKTIVLLLFPFTLAWNGVPSAHAQTTTIQVGANVNADVPIIPACSTFGFSVEQTITLPAGFNNIRMLRVDRSGSNPFGYALTSSATGYSVFVFDLRSMIQVATLTRTITGYVDRARLQGDVGGDGKLYVFNEVSNVNPSCTTSDCVMFSRFTVGNLDLSVVDNTGSLVMNIDDARESSSNFLAVIKATGGSLAEFRTYSKSSLTLQTTGTLTGRSASGLISRNINGILYAGLQDQVNPNIWTFPTDSPTNNGTLNINFTGAKRLQSLAPISALNLVSLDSDTNGGTNPQRAWISTPTFVGIGATDYSGGLADSDAVFQGTFYDSINNKVFSTRNAAGNAIFLRTTPGVAGFTTEQNFSCGASCSASSGNTQQVDYSQNLARLYFGTSDSPARISKVKVCATGGP